MVGISPGTWGNLGQARSFVSRYGLTFINLWDSSDAAWRHYGGPYTSEVMLVDSQGNRVEQATSRFSASKFQRLVDSLD